MRLLQKYQSSSLRRKTLERGAVIRAPKWSDVSVARRARTFQYLARRRWKEPSRPSIPGITIDAEISPTGSAEAGERSFSALSSPCCEGNGSLPLRHSRRSSLGNEGRRRTAGKVEEKREKVGGEEEEE